MKKVFWIILVISVIIIFVWTKNTFFKPTPKINPVNIDQVDVNNLPGIKTGPYPWSPETDHLKERLNILGLPALETEGTALHTHQHLDIFINGTHVEIPSEIGVNDNQGFVSPIHTHDNTGIVHVESPTIQTYTLGQFFDIWGVKFTTDCIGGYCTSSTNSLKIYSNGQLININPVDLLLEQHQEIVILFGNSQNSQFPIPKTFQFPAGY